MTNETLELVLRQWMTPLVSGAVALVAAVGATAVRSADLLAYLGGVDPT